MDALFEFAVFSFDCDRALTINVESDIEAARKTYDAAPNRH
jgi:hypothetical protein